MSPDSVGVHGRLLHTPEYAHTLEQRANNFHLLEDYVYAMSEAGADVVGQVGTNWVHANGTDHDATLTAASTLAELDPKPTIEVHVDSAVRGLGTAACGPDVLDRFVVGPGRHRFSWTIGAAR